VNGDERVEPRPASPADEDFLVVELLEVGIDFG